MIEMEEVSFGGDLYVMLAGVICAVTGGEWCRDARDVCVDG